MWKGFCALLVLCSFSAIGRAQEPLAGQWRGNWTSGANGHTGPLNARIEQQGGSVVVHFRGRFAKVVPFLYKSRLEVVAVDGNGTHLQGSQRLPLFGTFSTSATVKDGQFYAVFNSAKDNGTFTMTRVR
ncbi:MAG: hypothetical protein ACKOS8_04520 [Gemmataceae bacterium]